MIENIAVFFEAQKPTEEPQNSAAKMIENPTFFEDMVPLPRVYLNQVVFPEEMLNYDYSIF